MYKNNYKKGKKFGLIIEVEDYCQVYTNNEWKYFSEIIDTKDLKLEKYEIYKDYNLINNMKEICKNEVNWLVFVEDMYYEKISMNYISVKDSINVDKMKL